MPFLIALLLGSTLATAQSSLPLGKPEIYSLRGLTTTGIFPYLCDSSGNIYGRFRTSGPSSFAVTKFSPDGKKTTTFDTPDEPELRGNLVAFAPGTQSELYELVQMSNSRATILEFSGDGKFQRRTELAVSEPVRLSQLIAIGDQSFFVSGTQVGSKEGKGAGQPYNALFDASGKLISHLSLKGDIPPMDAPKRKDHDQSSSSNMAVDFGRSVAGPDGNLYVLRTVSPALIYVLSQNGELLRTLHIQPPVKGAEPIELKASTGQLAIEFHLPDAYDLEETRIRVVDSQTGESLNDYGITRQMTEALACFTPEAFTFFSTTGEFPAIVRAAIPH